MMRSAFVWCCLTLPLCAAELPQGGSYHRDWIDFNKNGFGEGVTVTVKPGHDASLDPFLKSYPAQYLATADTAEQQQALFRELWKHDPKKEGKVR